MSILMGLLGFVVGPIGRWVAMAGIGLLAMAWMRADAAAPWRHQVTELRTVIAKRDADAEKDRKLAEAYAARAEELENELKKLVESGGTKLSAAELDGLRRLARKR